MVQSGFDFRTLTGYSALFHLLHSVNLSIINFDFCINFSSSRVPPAPLSLSDTFKDLDTYVKYDVQVQCVG